MPSSVRTIGLGILSCGSALAIAACGVDQEGGSAPVDTEVAMPGLASPIGSEIALPEGFPSDVPRYPGAELVSVNVHGSDMLVAFESASDLPEVAEQLEREFASRGWSTKAFTDETGISVWADKEGRDATVLITAAAGRTRLEYILTH